MPRCVVTLILLIAILSCEQPVNARPSLLLALRANPDVVMEALVIGTLELRERCIVLRQDDASEHTVVWAAGTRLEGAGAHPKIVVSDGRAFHIGEQVRFGGGEISELSKKWRAFFPPDTDRCPAPYWVAQRFEPRGHK